MKRVPGILALLILFLTLAHYYGGGIIYIFRTPPGRPFTLPLIQAVWLASIFGSLICFLIAVIVPKTWRGGFAISVMGLMLLGSGWYYWKADELHLRDERPSQPSDPDVSRMKFELDILIPSRTPLIEAKRRMESAGFACTVIDEVRHPPHYRVRTFSAKPSMSLNCWKEDRWPKHKTVRRKWNVEFGFAPYQSPNPGVVSNYLYCEHYFWRVFLFSQVGTDISEDNAFILKLPPKKDGGWSDVPPK